MGTYDTRGGTPQSPDLDEAPCDICQKYADECECEENVDKIAYAEFNSIHKKDLAKQVTYIQYEWRSSAREMLETYYRVAGILDSGE